jgi:uncharacterized repeat protein (TIGR03943 family)
MKRWRTLWGLVEAACLLGLAVFIVYLLLAGNYWMYLNPKFKGVSWAAALALGGLGVYSAFKPPAGATWFRALVYVFVLSLCLASELGVRKWLATSGMDTQAMEEANAPLPSRVTKSGVEYVRINLGELFDIAGKSLKDKMDLNYAVRGFVRRTPESDAKGEFILYRVALWCCFADTTAVGYRVHAPKGQELPDDGSWQVVYGRLEASKDPSADAVTSLGGSVFASVQSDYLIEARRIETDKAPGMGMMYEWRTAEPYAY